MKSRNKGPSHLESLSHQLFRSAPTSKGGEYVQPPSAVKQFRAKQNLGTGRASSLLGSILGADELEKLGGYCDLSNPTGDMKCLEDLRMGAFEPDGPNSTCATCQCKFSVCPGHFGMIKLKPQNWFLHPFFVENGAVAGILNLFCFECFSKDFSQDSSSTPEATILFNDDMITALNKKFKMTRGLERLKALAKIAIPYSCREGHTATYFKKTPDNTVNQVLSKKSEDEKEITTQIDAAVMFYYLKSISDYLDVNGLYEFVGFNPIRFENLVVQIIPIIPTRNRSAVPINGVKQISPFTQLYQDMLRVVRILNSSDTPGGHLDAHRKELRDLYLAYKTGEGVSAAKNRGSDGTMRTLVATVDKKPGLWHKHAMGSRVNNSGRTPIYGNNDIRPNQVSIPKFMAEKWRIDLIVTAENVEICRQLLQKDIIKTVSEQTGQRKTVTPENKSRIDLKPGMKCQRRLVSGDVVIINRQPTLHKWSMLAMSAVVSENELPGKEVLAIGMNTIYVSGFNADFDGDEVHVHVPSSIEARAQAVAFMSVERTPISDQTSNNIFGLIQNSVWGIYAMSRDVKNMSRETWIRHAMAADNIPGPRGSDEDDFNLIQRINEIKATVPKLYANPKYAHLVKGLGIWNTNTLLSLAFPRDFSYVKRMREGEASIIIENGILISGALKKSVSGAGPGSIIQTLFAEQGPYRIVVYGYVMQQVVNDWMQSQGFTISITDFMPDEVQNAEIESIKDQKLGEIKRLAQRNIEGLINPDELSELLIKWINIPEKYKYIMTPQHVGRLRNEISYNLVDILQIETNIFMRGRSSVLFRDEKLLESLSGSISKTVDSSYAALKEGSKSNGLLASILVKNKSAQSAVDLQPLKDAIFASISRPTLDFVKKNTSDPMKPEFMTFKTQTEIDTLNADITDDLDGIKTEGIKILTKALMHAGIWNSKTQYKKNVTVRYVKGDQAQTYIALRDNIGKDPLTSLEDWAIPSRRGGMVTDMITSGARGNEGNLFQAKFALGNQTMDNKRIKAALNGGRRITPFFLENDPDPTSAGYVRNSLSQGNTPMEFLMAAMPARQTQTDTAFKTGETGYMRKELMASSGDFKIYADGSVRNEQGHIVSFLYAGHGIDPSRQIKKGDTYVFADVNQLVNQVNAEMNVASITRREYNRMF